MRLYSTQSSFEKNELSVLAVIETALAATASVMIAARIGTMICIAVSGAVAPLLLLRTKKSVVLGIVLYKRWFDWIAHHERWTRFFFPMIWGPLVVRVVAAAIGFFRYPGLTIREIPLNWSRITFCLDSCTLPEVIPGYNRYGFDDLLSPRSFLTEMWEQPSDLVRTLFSGVTKSQAALILLLLPVSVVGLVVVGCLLFIPPLAYRWTMKATSLLYLPLLWAIGSAYKTLPGTKEALRRIRSGELNQAGRMFAAIVIIGLAAKYVLLTGWNGYVEWWNDNAFVQVLGVYLRPKDIPLWQVASFVNSVIAFGLYWFAADALERYDHADAIPENRIEAVIRSTNFVRPLLTTYTIACTLYLTFATALDWPVPAVGGKLFPWL